MPGPLPVGDPMPADGRLPASARIDPATAFGVYVHVPFCRVRCGYCDFNTYTASELRGAHREDYAETVLREVAQSVDVLAAGGGVRSARTVFFGGGTPTLLPVQDLARMLEAVRDAHGVERGAEITVEANPDTVTAAGAAALAAAGVTRLSIGMQSAVPEVLEVLDREHDPRNVADAVAAARDAGLQVSLDLIYGSPGESLRQWQCSLDAALALDPDHVSAYALIVEEGTGLARRIRRGEVAPPDDDLSADMYELADEMLSAAGFDWYEVSNWARSSEHRSRHNLSYWTGADWWGYGPGAHSHVAGVRWWNVKHPAAYAQRLARGVSPGAGREVLDEDGALLEEVLLRSRIRDGLPTARLTEDGRHAVPSLIADGLIEGADAVRGRILLTLRGRLLADAVVRALTR